MPDPRVPGPEESLSPKERWGIYWTGTILIDASPRPSVAERGYSDGYRGDYHPNPRWGERKRSIYDRAFDLGDEKSGFDTQFARDDI